MKIRDRTNIEKISKSRRKAKKIKKNQIRKNHSKEGQGHPAYISGEIDGNYIYNGLTHAQITQGIRNLPLKNNPNKNDRTKSYVRPNVKKLNKNKFSKFLYDWEISKKDKKMIKRNNKNNKK